MTNNNYEIIDKDTLKIIKLTSEVINSLSKYNKIILHDDYNHPLPKLPDTIMHLTLGNKYNKPLNEYYSLLTKT